MLATIDVGYIYAAVGTNKPMVGFGDQYSAFAADNSFALRQDEFDHAWIQSIIRCPLLRGARRLDGVECNQLPFSLGNDFVFHHEDVALAQ